MDLKNIKKRLQRERKRFRSAENTRYYSRKDFRAAEKQFLITCVLNDRCRTDAAHAIAVDDVRRPAGKGGDHDGDTRE